MAPQRNRDKTRRRKRVNDTEMLYKCLGKLCGEECDQELQMVTDSPGSRSNRRNDPKQRQDPPPEDVEMDAMSDDDEDYQPPPRTSASHKMGRVSKTNLKKTSNDQNNLMPLKIGVEKAKHYLCAALDFGVQSGFLTPKDNKGQVLRVSSDLLQKNTAPPQPKSRIIRRLDAEGLESRRQERKRLRDSPENFMAMEERDAEPVADRGGSRRSKKHRSGSRRHGVKKRSGRSSRSRSRSRSRSKRRQGRKRAARSRSMNPEPNPRVKQVKSEDNEQRDSLEETNKEDTGNNNSRNNNNDNNNNNEDDNDDNKSQSQKSIKSEKSVPTIIDPQNINEEKKSDNEQQEDDGSVSGGSDLYEEHSTK